MICPGVKPGTDDGSCIVRGGGGAVNDAILERGVAAAVKAAEVYNRAPSAAGEMCWDCGRDGKGSC